MRCVIPKIEACQGCVQSVRVSVPAAGTCLITYEVRDAAVTAGMPGQLAVEVETPSRAARPRLRPRPRYAQAASRPGPRCFVFQGRSFCE